MADPFVHLHVASGYSLQYGASHPHVLVERAAEREMDTLALTDRNGTYGVVRFVKACLRTGVRPVLGVDLAMAPLHPWAVTPGSSGAADRPRNQSRTPVRGGTFRDARLPRATFLAASRQGWAALCRLVSATHLAGERGDPVCTLDLVAEHAAGRDVLVLLGPGSEPGRAVTLRRDDLARAALLPWRRLLDPADLLVEVVSHRLRGSGPGSSPHAARMAGLATEAGLGAVLGNAVRYADRSDAPVVDVLDAARRLVPLDLRHVDRGNAEGFLKSGKEMAEVAEEVCRFAGLDGHGRAARDLLARTRVVADRCAVDPRADLGLGEVHFPELGSGGEPGSADRVLRDRCEAGLTRRYGSAPSHRVRTRLDDELAVIETLGYASYFLTVADVSDLVRRMGVRAAARGSGAGSLVNYLTGVSGIDPLRHGLLMERFLSPLRQALPDVDIDVESARRLEVYEAILDRYGGERCACVSMMDTYRVRHTLRDTGAALGMPRGEVDAIAKAFPHIRAKDARLALRELPELRASGLGEERLDLLFRLAERLDGLPRHIAVHPCGVLLSDATLLDRTPVEASFAGFPMSQFDKEDVEDLGLLKLDVLGIRMQSTIAHTLAEIRRVDGVDLDVDDESQVPFDDEATFAMISASKTLGVFQIESPGQRELVGKSGIESFGEIITDISLFRPGPVKSDMVTPYLDAKQGWRPADYPHDDLRPILADTHGVVVFHEQVIEIIARLTGCTLAEADEARRALGDVEGMAQARVWFFPRALGRGYSPALVEEVWRILEAFASFGFCKAHAAAFALPTYQSAWLKAHYPAHFLAGVLTHDPGMYPKRLILDDARQFGVAVLPLDVNASEKEYVVERVPADAEGATQRPPERIPTPSGAGYGIRLALSEVKGIDSGEVDRIVAGRPYHSLTDFWQRARVSRPVVERLVLAGGFDAVYGIGARVRVRRRGRVTRRDLLLQVADLDRYTRAVDRASATRGRGLGARRGSPAAQVRATDAAGRNSSDAQTRENAREGVWAQAAAQSRAARKPMPVTSVQLSLDLGDAPADGEASGLPEMTVSERVRAELEILGLDVSQHVVTFYRPFLDELGVTRSVDLMSRRSHSELLVAGVKVATQTPPIRSGRRVVFLTLDDATGPVDATFFEDAQGPYAATVFHSWLLVVRGELRRTGRRGISLLATGCWELSALHDTWRTGGLEAVHAVMTQIPDGFAAEAGVPEQAVAGAAESRSTRPVMADPPSAGGATGPITGPITGHGHTAGGMGRRRVLVHSSGFAMSPYADVRPPGEDTRTAASRAGARGPDQPANARPSRKLWHSSPGSSGG
jgi:error-prone DNA polymerase